MKFRSLGFYGYVIFVFLLLAVVMYIRAALCDGILCFGHLFLLPFILTAAIVGCVFYYFWQKINKNPKSAAVIGAMTILTTLIVEYLILRNW
jgi:hypothetical protein